MAEKKKKEEKKEKENYHMLITAPLNEGGRDKNRIYENLSSRPSIFLIKSTDFTNANSNLKISKKWKIWQIMTQI